MQRQEPAAIASSTQDQESKKPSSMAISQEEFEFCVLSSGGLALAGEDAADMCAADEVFSGGKLLPLRPSSGDASALLLLRSDSLSTSGFSSRSNSSSSCVSRSTSSKSASSDPASLALGTLCLSNKSASSSLEAAVNKPARRSLSSSVFYAHPSPSPRPPPPRASAARRRSTGSAPPAAAAWGVIRLGVVGAPEVYPRRAPPVESRKVAAVATRGGSQSARFEQQASAGASTRKARLPVDKKLGLFGAGLACSCSPDAVVAPVGTVEAAAAEARRRRKKAQDNKRAARKQTTTGQSSSRRSRILHWMEEISMPKRAKNVV